MVRRYEPPCRPPLWARGGHAQTLLGYLLPTSGEVVDERTPGVLRREVPVPPSGAHDGDDDRLVVFDLPAASGGPLAGATFHLCHGLTGSSASNYMRLAARALGAEGAAVRLVNHRGQGAGEGLARGLYHSGSWPDLFAAVADARARGARGPHVAVGFSLSANTLLLGAASERAEGHPGHPDAVLAVNPPVDLISSVTRIGAGVNRVYDRNFVRGMRASFAARRAHGAPAVVVPRSATSVRALDEAVTAPAAGYPSAEAYYLDCSSGPRLGALRVPAAILTAADDPFVASGDVERAIRQARASRGPGAPALLAHVEPVGGHLGYLDRGGRRWLAGALAHYGAELLRSVGA